MTFSNKNMVKVLTFYVIINILYNYDTNLYHVKKGLFTLVLKLQDLIWIIYDTYKGVATGGIMALHFNFRTKQGPTVSVSNIRVIAFYGCSEIIRTRNFPICAVLIFGQFTAAFHFF